MGVTLNVKDDFSDVLDGLEAVTLHRLGSSETIAIGKAWRFSSLIEDPESAGGYVAQSNIQWQFEWDTTNKEPQIGDSLVDVNNQCWTILSVEQLGAKTRYRCLTRNLQIAHGLYQRVDVQQAIWEDLGAGPVITGWFVVKPAVPARIQPDRVTIDNQVSPPTSTATYRVILGEQLDLNENHRLVDPEGTIYQLVEYFQAERIDMLPVATVIQQ